MTVAVGRVAFEEFEEFEAFFEVAKEEWSRMLSRMLVMGGEGELDKWPQLLQARLASCMESAYGISCRKAPFLYPISSFALGST